MPSTSSSRRASTPPTLELAGSRRALAWRLTPGLVLLLFLGIWAAVSGIVVGWFCVALFGYFTVRYVSWLVCPPRVVVGEGILGFPLGTGRQTTVALRSCGAFRVWWGKFVTFDCDEASGLSRAMSRVNHVFGGGTYSIAASLYRVDAHDLANLLNETRDELVGQ